MPQTGSIEGCILTAGTGTVNTRQRSIKSAASPTLPPPSICGTHSRRAMEISQRLRRRPSMTPAPQASVCRRVTCGTTSVITVAVPCRHGTVPTRVLHGILALQAMLYGSPPPVIATAVAVSALLAATATIGPRRPTSATPVTISTSIRSTATGPGPATLGLTASPSVPSLKNNVLSHPFIRRPALQRPAVKDHGRDDGTVLLIRQSHKSGEGGATATANGTALLFHRIFAKVGANAESTI